METKYDLGANLQEIAALAKELCEMPSPCYIARVCVKGDHASGTLETPELLINIFLRGKLTDVFRENYPLSDIDAIRDAFEGAKELMRTAGTKKEWLEHQIKALQDEMATLKD